MLLALALQAVRWPTYLPTASQPGAEAAALLALAQVAVAGSSRHM